MQNQVLGCAATLWLAKVKEEARHSGQELEEDKTWKAKGRAGRPDVLQFMGSQRVRHDSD